MTDSDHHGPDTTDMDYLTRLMDEADADGQSLLDMVDDTRRRYTRKACFIEVDYCVADLAFKGFIRNLSPNGAFVETHGTFPVGRDVTMTFSSPTCEKPV